MSRVAQLGKLFQKVVEKSFPDNPLAFTLLLQQIKSDVPKEILEKSNLATFRDLYFQTMRSIRAGSTEEFEKICNEFLLPEKLSLLDSLMSDQPVVDETTGARLSPSNPDSIIGELVESQLIRLTNLAEMAEEELKVSMEKLENKRKEISQISNLVQHLIEVDKSYSTKSS